VVEVAEEARASILQVSSNPAVKVGLRRIDRGRYKPRRVAAQVERNPTVARTQRTPSDPHHLAHRDELVEQPRGIAADAGSDDVALDHGRRQGETLQLEDDFEQPVHAAGAT